MLVQAHKASRYLCALWGGGIRQRLRPVSPPVCAAHRPW